MEGKIYGKVGGHCHLTGIFRAAAHNKSNMNTNYC